MTCGEMRNTVTIQKGTETKDDARQAQITWADWATRAAAITPLRGMDRIQASQLDSKVTHKMMLHWDGKTKLITPHLYRVKFGQRPDPKNPDTLKDRIFDINAAVNVREQNHTLELHCTEAI